MTSTEEAPATSTDTKEHHMALYTGAAYFHVDGQAAPKLTGSGLQRELTTTADLLDERIRTDAVGSVGDITASITEDNPTGSQVLFSVTGSLGVVLVTLRGYRDAIAS